MRLKTIVIGAALAVAGAIGVGVAILATMDFNAYRGLIADQVKAATGRNLDIKGNLKLALSLSPAVAAEDVTFANAPWGSRPEMARIKRLEAKVELLPLIFSKTVKVKRLVLVGPDILLETDPQGQANWVFQSAPSGAPAPAKPSVASEAQPKSLPQVHEVDIRDATIAFRDGRSKQSRQIRLTSGTLNAKSNIEPIAIEVDELVEGRKFHIGGTLGSLNALEQIGTPFPLNLQVKAADATFKLSGLLREPLRGKGYDISLAGEGSEVAKLAEIGGVKLAAIGPFRIALKVNDSTASGHPSISEVKLELGRPELALVKIDGAIRDPLGHKGMTLRVSAEGREIGALSGFAVPGLAKPFPLIPALGPFQASARIEEAGGRMAVPSLKIDVGKPELLKLDAEGSIHDALGPTGVRLNVAAAAPELSNVLRLAGLELAPQGALTLSLKVADAGPGRYAVSDLKLRAGRNDLSGEASLAFAGQRPLITANLASTAIDTASFAVVGPSPGPGRGPAAAPRANDGRAFSDEALPFDLLSLVDSEIRYRVQSLATPKLALSNVSLASVTKGGEFNLKPLTAEVSGGRVTIELTANARGQSVAGRIEGRGVNLGALLKELQATNVLGGGKTDFTSEFRGSGRSPRTIMASLNGGTTLVVGQGDLANSYIDLLGADVLRVFGAVLDSRGRTNLNCAISRFDIQNGVANSRILLIDSGRMTVQGGGAVNLGTEVLSMIVVPRPKDAALVSLALPVRIGGTLTSPRFSPDPSAAAKDAATAAIGALLLGPVGILAPLVSGGQRGVDPCAQAMTQLTGQRPGNIQSPEQSGRRPERGLGGAVDGIGRELRGILGR